MKLIEKIGFILFIIGLIFKFLHFPGAPILMILGLLLLLVFYTIAIFKKNTTSKQFINLTSTLWLVFILFRIQYWHYVNIPLILAFILTIYTIIPIVKNKYYLKLNIISYIIVIVTSIIILFTPAHKLYYIINLNPLLNQETRMYSYRAWNKYSWFLYNAGQIENSLKANGNAIKSAENYFETIQLNNSHTISCLNLNKQKIIHNTWYKLEDCNINYNY